LEEEAALAFAACGFTGPVYADLPFGDGSDATAGGGNIMAGLLGRTVASADALHTVSVFVINDEGTWLLRRPQEYPASDLQDLLALLREDRLIDLYVRSRVRIVDHRTDVPREVPVVPPFNQWSANRPGATYFLPVNELSALCLNMCLSALSEEFGFYILDDRAGFAPAGVQAFAKSRGGHLHDDPGNGRVITISGLETWVAELSAVEQGGVLQNLGLMAQALGLGGFPHFAAHPFAWTMALGFRMAEVSLTRLAGCDAGAESLGIPFPVGLERAGEVLLKPFCPPFFESMTSAVSAFLTAKFGEHQGLRCSDPARSLWADPGRVVAAIPTHSPDAINAPQCFAEYVYQRYGRFPASTGPFRTLLAYQAHVLDTEFYNRFYRVDGPEGT
jgi:hypothetical protein